MCMRNERSMRMRGIWVMLASRVGEMLGKAEKRSHRKSPHKCPSSLPGISTEHCSLDPQRGGWEILRHTSGRSVCSPSPQTKHFPELTQPLLILPMLFQRTVREVLGGGGQRTGCLGLNSLLLTSGGLFNFSRSQFCHL